MSLKQLLIYELVTPVSKQRHHSATVTTTGYSFASEVNSIPLMAVEFREAAHAYPIVFSVDGETVLPIVVVGLDSGRSLYVRPDGSWNSDYVPAFIRRYPFVFSAAEDGNLLTLCIDEAYEGLHRRGGAGERLFDDEGDRTPFLDRMLGFVNAYQGEHAKTKAFGAMLRDNDLLEPSQANITLPEGSTRQLTAFNCVSRDKLKALAPEKLAELAANDALELIYLHLYSLRNFTALVSRFAGLSEQRSSMSGIPESQFVTAQEHSRAS